MKQRAAGLAWFLLPGCLLLLIVGLRWGLAERYGMALPDWDQWDAESLHLLEPYYQGHLTWAELFLPQNEHRVVVTKLLNLGLAVANGQWDQRVEVVVNNLFPALLATGLFCFGRRHLAPSWQGPLFCVLTALYGLPIAWENIVNGFHSPQHLLIGLSFVAIALLPFRGPRSPAWWVGLLCLILALGTLASGFFAALVVGALVLARGGQRSGEPRSRGLTLVACAAAVAVGFLTRVTVAGHAPLKAHSAIDFVMSVVRALGWPAFESGWGAAGLLLWLPWAWIAGRACRARRLPEEPFGQVLLGLGGWVVLQVLATAYARGAGAPPPASRYIDTLAAGLAVNALGLAWLLETQLARQPGQWKSVTVAGAGWTLLFTSGLAVQVTSLWQHELPLAQVTFYYCEQNVRHYLASGDPAFLDHAEIPYPSAAALIARLEVPAVRRILPSTVRLPLPLVPADAPAGWDRLDTRRPQDAPAPPRAANSGLSPGTSPLAEAITWGSYGAPGGVPAGPWQSRPVTPTVHGWLQFTVAGDVGEPGSDLELRDAGSGQVLATVRPDRHPGERWRSAYVPAPAGPFVVVAAERAPGQWFAFSEPVEMGEASYWAWRLLKQGFFLAELAAGAAAVLGLAVTISGGPAPGLGRPSP